MLGPRFAVARYCAALLLAVSAARAQESLQIVPAEARLEGNYSQLQLLVTKADANITEDRRDDLTSQAKYESSNPGIVSVGSGGLLLAQQNGQAAIVVTAGDQRREVPVMVSGIIEHPPVRFTRDIRPILTKSGCAMAACHAAQYGQGGFKLSVFGFDPDQDRAAMVRDSIGRRVNRVMPDHSLLLLKPTAQMPHGGGKRLGKDSVDYQILRTWIAGGAPGPVKDEPEVKRLTVQPARCVSSIGAKQQLRVEAEYADGSRRDVTAWARFDTTDEGVVKVTRDGLATT
jgi:hypothetical protein